jgi:hypothetical protein
LFPRTIFNVVEVLDWQRPTLFSSSSLVPTPPPSAGIHCKKKVCNIPVTAGMSLTKLTLDGNNLIIPVLGKLGYWLVTDIQGWGLENG